MYYQIVSFNYKTCSLQEREAIAFHSEDEIKEFLNYLTEFDSIVEAFVINTCNRVEIVTASKDEFATYHAILGLLSKHKNVNFYELEKKAKRYENKEAIKHFFSVISSLDSMVVGEAQITGQVKEGFFLSYKNKTAGSELEKLLNFGIKCAAEVRNATNISEHPISIASVAVSQAEEELGSLSGMVAVVVGTGEMGRLAAKHLLRLGVDVLLVSRNKEKTKLLAKELGENVKVGSFEKIPYYINKYRLLFSATASKEPIITKEMVEEKNIKRLWFDMAIPRDIEDDIPVENVKIYQIDDLQEISKKNHALRKEQAYIAMEIVEKYTDEFFKYMQALRVEPFIKQMRLCIKEIVQEETKRVIKKGFLPKEYEENILHFGEQLFDKFLHNPTKRLRILSKEKEGSLLTEAIQEIFLFERKDKQ